jgi:hypothetical protein
MVVVYNGGKDINLPLGWDPRPGYPFNFLLYENHPFHLVDYPAFSLAAYGSHFLRIAGHSYFQEKFSRRDSLRREVQWNTDPWREEIATVYARNMEVAAAVARAFNSDFILFIRPTLLSKARLTEDEITRLKALSAVTGQSESSLRSHDLFLRRAIDEKLSKSSERDGFGYVDLKGIHDDAQESVFVDVVHTHQAANAVVARHIFEILRKRMELRP